MIQAFFAYRAWKLWGRPKGLGYFLPPMWYVPPLRQGYKLNGSVGLFVTSILLQVFALDGYTTRKFSIVLYIWVSRLMA
jgi:hypothetical protein